MFELEKFSEILNKIVKLYGNITYLANAADVGRSYLSKYIHNKLPSPPTPKILEKIAEASHGITNYDELMQICGYLDVNMSSKEIIAQNICRNYKSEISNLNIPNLDIQHIFEILIKQNETDNTVLTELNNFIEYNYGINDSTKSLFEILSNIDHQIKNIIVMPNNIGIPLYSINTFPMYKVSYFPFECKDQRKYIAVKATNDKMLPLLGINDIAVIHMHDNLIDGQTDLLLIDNSYYEIAKVVSEGDICKLYYSNSKYDEVAINRITVIGEIILSQNTSAFNRKGGI